MAGTGRFGSRTRVTLATGIAVVAVAGLTACGGKHHAAALAGAEQSSTATSTSATPTPSTTPPAPAAALTFNPADGTSGVSPATPITVTAVGGTIGDVSLKSSTGPT